MAHDASILGGVAVGTVVTLLLGALVGLLGQGLMVLVNDQVKRKSEERESQRALQKEEREAQRALEKEEREAQRAKAAAAEAAAALRQDDAATRIFKAFNDLDGGIYGNPRSSVPGEGGRPDPSDLLSEIRIQAAHLPPEWREIISPLTEIIADAGRLSSEHWHFDSRYAIVRNTCRFGRDLCADLLSRRPMSEVPRIVRMYRVSLEDLNADEGDRHVDIIAEIERDEEEWLRLHPDFK